eukprot:6187324-Pleurochrysis_carterae.AAC.3
MLSEQQEKGARRGEKGGGKSWARPHRSAQDDDDDDDDSGGRTHRLQLHLRRLALALGRPPRLEPARGAGVER